MKKIFKQIWKEAQSMQDLREDKGHAKVVTEFAVKLCTILKANEKIVVPAAILHDIGYYGMDEQVLKNLMMGKLSENVAKKIKEEHMEKGAGLAEKLLRKINYNPKLIERIIKVIKKHDLDVESTSTEENIVRDADKLWRFSKSGFNVDVKRRGCPPIEWYNYLFKNINKENYFQTNEAKEIAAKELENRKNENKI